MHMDSNFKFFNALTLIILVLCICGAGFAFITGEALAGIFAIAAAGIDILATAYWSKGKKREAELLTMNMLLTKEIASLKSPSVEDAENKIGSLKTKVKKMAAKKEE